VPPESTLGVEEEFLLVDPATGHPVNKSEPVLVRAAGENAATEVHAELHGTQVEAATGICVRLTELDTQLRHGRQALAAAAADTGTWLVASGTPVLAGEPVPGKEKRFERIVASYAGLVADYQCCGCHVHVGVPDREIAVAVANHLAPWLPTLLALSANSPFQHGTDTGYASWRMIMQAWFPGAGVTPWFGSAAEYDAAVDRLVDCGVLADPRMSFWLARPSARFPTVELRVADTAGTVPEAALQAGLSRALVGTALAELAAGREAEPVDGQLAAAAVWSAARYGLRGPGIHLRTGKPVPATDLLHEMITQCSPALAERGDLAFVRDTAAAVLAGGTGADQQRRAAATGPLGVVRMLARRTLAGVVAEPIGAP
jgi:carboxylate-amine ligase